MSGVTKKEVDRIANDLILLASYISNRELPMLQCLELLGQEANSAETRRVAVFAHEKLSEGYSFAEAFKMAESEIWSSPLAIAMFNVGEMGGFLGAALCHLSDCLAYKERCPDDYWRFNRSMFLIILGRMIKCGVPAEQALFLAVEIIEDPIIKAAILSVKTMLTAFGIEVRETDDILDNIFGTKASSLICRATSESGLADLLEQAAPAVMGY